MERNDDSTDGRWARVAEQEGQINVLVVDDEDVFRNVVERLLQHGGFKVTTVSDGFAALSALEREVFDVLLVDVNMPLMSGPELLARVRTTACTAEVVMMSASNDIGIAVSAVKGGAFGFLTKPFVSDDAVVIELRKAAEKKRLQQRTEELQLQLLSRSPRNEMLGRSPKMRELFLLISGVATTDSTLLVLGESGTGKELVARAVHECSRRASKPFVCVNCGALPPDLVESELFGHARGAFTSAASSRAGLFEAANGGTLLLDEIGDLPMSAQVKLLRALQEGEIKPVGTDYAKKVDVRVIAATNVDLKAATTAGRFRQDLYFRLNVIPLRIPPLRERGDDVLLLAHSFLQRHVQAVGRMPLRLSDEVTARLRAYSWPGNVRELDHAMEHAVVFSTGEVVQLASLPMEVRGEAEHTGDGIASTMALEASGESGAATASSMKSFVAARGLHALPYIEARRRVVSEFNEAYVAAALGACGGNISEAARQSGVDRSNFRRLMRATHPLVSPNGTKAERR